MWNVVENTNNNEYLYTIRFVKSDSTASISVAVLKTPLNGPISDLSERLVDVAQQAFSDFNLVYETTRFVGGLECYQIEHTFTALGHSMLARQVFFVENGNVFLINYAARESEYADYLSDAENSIESFRIVPAQNSTSNNPFVIPAVIGVAVAVVVAIAAILLLRKKRKPESTIGTDASALNDGANVKVEAYGYGKP